MIYSMDKALKRDKMDQNILEGLLKALKRAQENIYGVTDRDTMVNGKIIDEMDLVNIIGKTGVNITGPGLRTNSMEWEFILTKMESVTKVSSFTIKKKAMDYIFGQMDARMMVGGTKESNMVLEYFKTLRKIKRSGVCGKTESE